MQGVGQRFQMQQGPGDGERPEPPEGEMSQFGADESPELPEGEAGDKSGSGDKEDQEERQIIRQEKDNGHQSGQMMQSRNLEQHVQENNMTSSDDSVEGAFAKIINWFKSFLS